MDEHEERYLLSLEPLSAESKEKIEWIDKILKIRVTNDTNQEKHIKWFDELYEKSVPELIIFYNVFK